MKKDKNDINTSDLIHELKLHQIELEIQNEDLLKTQLDLISSRNKYIEFYELAPIGYFSLDKNAIIKEVNQAGCQLLGLNKSSLINRCFTRYIVPEDQTLFSSYRKQILKNLSKKSFEIKLQKWNHPSFFSVIDFKAILDENTNEKHLLTFVTDITHRKAFENNLHQKRIKMSSIDRLHSLNEFIINLSDNQNDSITIINNYLNGCIQRLETNNYETSELLKILKKTLTQASILEKIIYEKMSSLEKISYSFEKGNINTIVNQSMQLLTYEMTDYPVVIQYDLDEYDFDLKLDILHIQQAILNIARNAFEALRDANILEPKLLIETSITEEKMIKVSFSDNGPGFLEKTLPDLFKPHFTTKNYAIGLGLSVSKKIIEKHGGELFASSNPYGGACFYFTLCPSS
jgi:PAS domain S-box-containing protein